MPTFAYKAYQGPGVVVDGHLQAPSEHEAADTLLGRGLQPVAIRRKRDKIDLRTLLRPGLHISRRDRSDFARSLADLTSAGMPVLQALEVIARQTGSERTRRLAERLASSLRDGSSLADALEAIPEAFDRLHVSLVRAGERAGLVPVVLRQIADVEDRELELRAKVESSLTYPTITIVAASMTILIVLNYVVPRLSSIFDEMGQSLPILTRILIGASEFVQAAWGYGLWILLALLLSIRFISRSARWKLLRDRWLLKLPLIGKVQTAAGISRFGGILGALLRNGVPLVQAVGITRDTIGNEQTRSLLDRTLHRLEGGASLGQALEDDEVFPDVVAGTISVAEYAGDLESTLSRVSENYAAVADRSVRRLVSLIEPTLIIGMGVFVAFIVASILLPIFEVSLTI